MKKTSMKLGNSIHSVAPDVVISFLREIMPFRELASEELTEIAKHCRVDFFPKGSRLMNVDETEITHLYLVQQGGVKAFLIDGKGEEVLKDYRGQGSFIGALGIIRGTRANLNIETVQDTFCFLLPRHVFLDLVKSNPTFSHFFLKSFSDHIVNTAYMELRHQKISHRATEDLYLFNISAGELAKSARKMSMTSTIQEVAQTMAQLRIGSMLLHVPDDPDEIIGIITDTDLRMKVVANGMDYTAPVETVMSTPLQSVMADEICFDVLLKMMSTGIRHLAVEKEGRVTGMLTSRDITVLQGHSPFYLFKEIVKQREISNLYDLARKIPEIIRTLIQEGGKAGNISRMISILNDQIVRQLLFLLEKELGPPPLSYCWLLMGSEGRREQTFITDQDNAIVYSDPCNAEEKEYAERYFSLFAEKAIGHLLLCGYPLCPGNIMATNPKWCQPFSTWMTYFTKWVNESNPEELTNKAIFFDFRGSYGDEKLAASLRNHVVDLTLKEPRFIHHLARQCLVNTVPLSFFNNYIVERDGEHTSRLDIKKRGLVPIVGFARALSLKYGVRETNTLSRLQTLAKQGQLPIELAQSAIKAFELQMQFRIIHQLEQIEQKKNPDNIIDPAFLTEMERTMLKDTFQIIESMQEMLNHDYPSSDSSVLK